jgi:hypothetical protein
MESGQATMILQALNQIANQLGQIKLALQGIEKKLDKNEKKSKGKLKARTIGEEDD